MDFSYAYNKAIIRLNS